MKINRHSLLHGAAALIALAVLACMPNQILAGDSATANKSSVPQTPPPNAAQDLLMSFNENLTSNSTLDGNVILTGPVSVRGTRHEDFTVTGVNSDNSEVYLAGTSTITATGGTMTTSWTGTIHFDNATFDTSQLAYVDGRESITGGTGAYAGASGNGTFEATLDYTTGNVLGVFESKLKFRR